jgi:fluoroacetyl-CoA thioesterase
VRVAELQAGLTGEASYTTGPEHSAARFGADVEVYGTPLLVGLIEAAAIDALKDSLPEGSTTVGAGMTFQHTAATPIGAAVRARAELMQVDGRRLVFRVEAFDPWEQIGAADHERFVVNKARFLSRVEEKQSRSTSA